MHLAREFQRIDDTRAAMHDRRQIEQTELVVDERDIECSIVEDQLRAADEVDKFPRHFPELRLIA